MVTLFYIDPTCQLPSASLGWLIKNRGGPDSAGWTMVSPGKQFSCVGQIIEWRYQAKYSRAFRAVVWRPVEGSNTQFQIVGINDIPAGATNTPVTYTVPVDDLIKVQPGDMIGWSFGGGVITYNGGGGTLVRWTGGHLHASLDVGQVHNINHGAGNREYSIEATVVRGIIWLQSLIFPLYLCSCSNRKCNFKIFHLDKKF